MSLLLDAHTFFWWLTGSSSLSQAAQKAIEEGTCFVSAATASELSNKVRFGKFEAAKEVIANLSDILRHNNFGPLPVSLEHASHAGNLPGIHQDPFDRPLAAQSLVEGYPLVTNDHVFREFGVETVW